MTQETAQNHVEVPVQALISAEDVTVVPDQASPQRFGLQVRPNTVAARGVEQAVRAARRDLINAQGVVPPAAKEAVAPVRMLYTNTQDAQHIASAQGRPVQPEAVYFRPEEAAIVMHGLERAAGDRSQGDQYAAEIGGTQAAIVGQMEALGLPMPAVPQPVPVKPKPEQ